MFYVGFTDSSFRNLNTSTGSGRGSRFQESPEHSAARLLIEIGLQILNSDGDFLGLPAFGFQVAGRASDQVSVWR